MRSTGGGREKKERAAARAVAGRGKRERAMPKRLPERNRITGETPVNVKTRKLRGWNPVNVERGNVQGMDGSLEHGEKADWIAV